MTSIRSLKIYAAATWYIGCVVLASKGITLLVDAKKIDPNQTWIWLAIILGLLMGLLKAKYLFNKSCMNNLARIDSLHEPKAWQFFRPRFFLLLTAMIIAGATLSKLSQNNYPLAISVATLDLSLATALLVSSYNFWKYKSFSNAP